MKMSIIALSIVLAMAIFAMTGCAPTRIIYREMPEKTSKSALVKQGLPFNKKPIDGKGWEAEIHGQIEAKVTNKDGTIVEIKTMKPSIMEKIMGFWYIAKPDNVGVGGK